MLSAPVMRWMTLGLVLAAPACMPIRYAPVDAPAEAMPDIPTPPEAPDVGKGRLVVDVAGEHAKVAKVVEVPVTYPLRGNAQASAHPGFIRNDELLCISPCVLDMPQGAHELAFTSLSDPERTSTADVVVSSQPAAIRHSLGRDKPVGWQYFTGFMMTLMGGMLVTGGGAVTVIGLATNGSDRQPTQNPSQHEATPTAVITVGLVMLGVGLATGAGGIALMNNNRPEHQDGATVYWPIKQKEEHALSAGR